MGILSHIFIGIQSIYDSAAMDKILGCSIRSFSPLVSSLRFRGASHGILAWREINRVGCS